MQPAKRKGQMELMGLALIVVIMVIALFMAIVFLARSPPSTVKESFQYDQLATNFIVALLKTSDCDVTVEKLIQDCSLQQRITCGGETSCDQVKSTIQEIKNNTLDEWGLYYNLVVDMPVDFEIIFASPECAEGQQVNRATEGFQPISLYPSPGQATVTLSLCKV
tara:strand:- start:91 stop:585 length:495 start_codon:yes stop_codon:yes gene_type:complete